MADGAPEEPQPQVAPPPQSQEEEAVEEEAAGQPPLPPASATPPADGAAGPSSAPPLPPEEEEDPLVVAWRKREELEKAAQQNQVVEIPPYDEEALKEFYADLRDAEREGEVNRILGAFKLNPYEQMGLKFDAAYEDVRRQYRKVSLMVHPDKCKHPRAKDAFEIIGQAQKELLDEDRRKTLDFLLGHAKEEVVKEWKKAAKHDAAARLAAVMNEDGREGLVASYEGTPEFQEAWKAKARDVMARAEWRKRKLTKRIAEEEERAKEEFKEERDVAKARAQHEKAWEKSREERVGTWRDFAKKKMTVARGAGGLKPPKQKESDADKRYIQRAVGEQWRPQQGKPQNQQR